MTCPSDSERIDSQRLNLLLHILRPLNCFLNLLFILQTRLAGKGVMQTRLEVLITQWILFSQIQKFWQFRSQRMS